MIALCNQTCVDAVREAGGRNFARMIMVPPYAASPSAAMSNTFSLPEDPSGRVLLSVHAYTPYQLCMLGTKKYSEFNDDCRTEISGLMSGLFSRFIKKGVPVIIGETGCTNKGNPEERRKWAEYFFSKACRRGITCVIWDNGEVGVGEENFGLYDRVSHKIFPESESYYEGMISGLSK